MIEKQTGRKIKFFCSDQGGKFTSKEFSDFLEEQGILRETTAPYTLEQNGLAERMNQTLASGANSMFQHSGLSMGFWVDAMATAAHVINRSPHKGLG